MRCHGQGRRKGGVGGREGRVGREIGREGRREEGSWEGGRMGELAPSRPSDLFFRRHESSLKDRIMPAHEIRFRQPRLRGLGVGGPAMGRRGGVKCPIKTMMMMNLFVDTFDL